MFFIANTLFRIQKKLLLLFSCIVFLSCSLLSKEEKITDRDSHSIDLVDIGTTENKIIDSIYIEMNGNGITDKVYIKQMDSTTLRFSILLDDTFIINNDKLIFPIGYLYYEKTPTFKNINMSVNDEKTLIITQEYGGSNPEGWYSQYINYDSFTNQILLDSASHEWKNHRALNDSDFIKREVIIVNKKVEDCDVMDIYDLD